VRANAALVAGTIRGLSHTSSKGVFNVCSRSARTPFASRAEGASQDTLRSQAAPRRIFVMEDGR
jgi:hypothetical protein